jgi:hypothetical protein
MSIALDIGSHRIQSLRREDNRLIASNRRCAYAVLPDSPTHRRLLEQAQMSYVVCDEGLLLVGDAAEDNSSLFKSTCRTLLPAGRIPQNDPLARQVMGSLIETALPVSGWTTGAGTVAPTCCLTLPGGTDLDGNGTRSDFEFFQQCIRLRGYEPRIVPAGAAVVLAELVKDSFTGVGMVFGSSGCEALLTHRGKPICHARTTFGGQWLDDQLAERQKKVTYNPTGERYLNVPEMSQRKASLQGSISQPSNSFEECLADLMTNSCVSLVDSFRSEISSNPQTSELPQPMPVVCVGGITKIPGFDALITEVLHHLDLGIQVQPPHVVKNDTFTIARGLLIDAELNAASQKSQSRAA